MPLGVRRQRVRSSGGLLAGVRSVRIEGYDSMRIAVYKDNLSTGRGADGAVRNFAAGLAERGHAVSLMEKEEFFSRVLNASRGACAEGDDGGTVFDVIVATGSNEIVDLDSAGYFSRPSRAKVVLQLHLAPRGFFKWKHPFRNRRIRAAFDKPDAVQVLCSSYVEEFRRLAPHPRVFVIGNYVPSAVGSQPPASLPPTADRLDAKQVVLYPAAAVNKVKNQMLLIDAFARVAEEFPGWEVRLLGKDTTSYAADCRRKVMRLGLSDRVEFVGFTTDLGGEYSRAEFIAFPSKLEGFPLAILEAAGFALPVLAQQGLPGVSDIVKAGETGLVTGASVSAYADGLRLLMADESLRRRLGCGAKSYCAGRYSRDEVLNEWERLLALVVRA